MENLLPASLGKTSGVYVIRNTIDHKVYVGSSCNLIKRYHDHQRDLNLGTHANTLLQNFANKYGCKTLQFGLLELCSRELLLVTEQKYVDQYRAYYREKGFNLRRFAGRSAGYSPSVATREKLAAYRRGRKMSEETKQKIATGNTGKFVSLETRAKMSAARKGVKKTRKNKLDGLP